MDVAHARVVLDPELVRQRIDPGHLLRREGCRVGYDKSESILNISYAT